MKCCDIIICCLRKTNEIEFYLFSYKGDDKMLAASLLATKDGARLLSYIEATQKGLTRLNETRNYTYSALHIYNMS